MEVQLGLNPPVRKAMMRMRTSTAGTTSQRRVARWGLSAIALLALAGADSAVARAASPDRTPPTFAGLTSATTCIPGPIDGQSASYALSWDPATDDVTPAKQITYDVYQASKSGSEDFSSPTYTVRHGTTSFATPPLPANQQFYFVIRARDRAGNEDANQVERAGVNLCV
jgi:hypothetical protein